MPYDGSIKKLLCAKPTVCATNLSRPPPKGHTGQKYASAKCFATVNLPTSETLTGECEKAKLIAIYRGIRAKLSLPGRSLSRGL